MGAVVAAGNQAADPKAWCFLPGWSRPSGGSSTSLTAKASPFRTPISRERRDDEVVFTCKALQDQFLDAGISLAIPIHARTVPAGGDNPGGIVTETKGSSHGKDRLRDARMPARQRRAGQRPRLATSAAI